MEGWKIPNLRLNSATAASTYPVQLKEIPICGQYSSSTALHNTMSISSFFSSLVGPLHADAPEEAKISEAQPQEEVVAVEADEDEEEPEDVRLPVLFVRGAFPLSQVFWACQIHPQLREEAQESPKCKAAAQHFFHCQEKVQSGKGFKHEDCVEEMCVFFASFLSTLS